MSEKNARRWVLALESSTVNGGAALVRDGEVAAVVRLEEGLRHGRELMPAAAALLEDNNLRPADLWGVAVSYGPGSYTGIRVGVMAAKALAYGAGCGLTAVSSLAALATSLLLENQAVPGDRVMAVQDARRDEVYVGLYRIEKDGAVAILPDAAVTPEEAMARLCELETDDQGRLLAVGSGLSTYGDLFVDTGAMLASCGAVHPGAVGLLGWRQLLREEIADPMHLQPVYLRRDEGADWRHDHLITQGK